MADWTKIREDLVKARTGKSTKQWHAILDRFELKKNGHTLAARYLREIHKLPDWWAQVVVIRYEYEVGIKKKMKKKEQAARKTKKKSNSGKK